MKMRFPSAGFLVTWFCLAAALGTVPAYAQQVEQRNGAAAKAKLTSDQKWVVDTLQTTTPTIFETNGKGSFIRINFLYTDVKFVTPCKLQYMENKYIVRPGDKEHQLTPISFDLTKVSPNSHTIKRYSAIDPAPDGYRFSVDANVVALGSADTKVHPIMFDGPQTAERLASVLEGMAQSCAPGK